MKKAGIVYISALQGESPSMKKEGAAPVKQVATKQLEFEYEGTAREGRMGQNCSSIYFENFSVLQNATVGR